MWQRQYFCIEAESEEEANRIAEKYKDVDVSLEENVYESENLYETIEYITPAENNGCATMEVHNGRNDKLIAKNGE